MKRTAAILFTIIMAVILCAGSTGAAEQPPEYSIEENTAENRTTYPYVVHTESSTWYLAEDDIALLGEEAFFEGLWETLKNLDADYADAREALSGFIFEEIEPIEIRTDFCAKAGISEIGGAYYNGRSNFIKVFYGWDTAKASLMHEYVHYLTIHCTDNPVTHGLFAEGLAEYISTIVCKNRMLRDCYSHVATEEETTFLRDHGAWDAEEGCLDPRLVCFGTAELIVNGGLQGQEFLSTADVLTTRTPEIQEHPTAETISHTEAACIMAYLAEKYTRESLLSHMSINAAEMEQVFGESFEDVYEHWKTWNKEHCNELGLIT